MNNQALSNFEIIGLTLSLGTLLGSCGINVAHELGHKQNFLAQICSVILLTPSFYNHFIIEHNKGHHKYVATPGDPATAKLRESIYRFWIRSVVGTYLNAWKIEFKRMEKNKWPKFYYKNLMILFFILNVIYVMAILYFFGTFAACVLIAAGTISFLFLETINYVEHYGLKRDLLTNGRYERVMPKHSWNSNHYLGRIILYELTRHSDHHYLANKKYQILDHHESSPQLPYGYPSSMLLSLIPPLWFKIMDKRLKSYATV
jgi:alkane 1-monooxygenase